MYDLHAHSTYSDGSLCPQALVLRAKSQGVNCLALTDHDTVAGYMEARQAAQREGLVLIPGIEFSCQWQGRGIHIVGLNIDPQHSGLVSAVAHQRQCRLERAQLIAQKLSKVGIEGALVGAKAEAGQGIIGRPHFAHYLVKAGYVSSVNMAFKRYLGAGKPGDVKQLWPDLPTVVEWIIEARGVAVLAHPDKYKMTRTKLGQLLQDFCQAGGLAMEVISGRQIPSVTRELLKMAKKYQLYASFGSDFHVPGQAWQELGQYGELPQDCEPVWQLWSDSKS